jgi:hypothetical protein
VYPGSGCPPHKDGTFFAIQSPKAAKKRPSLLEILRSRGDGPGWPTDTRRFDDFRHGRPVLLNSGLDKTSKPASAMI